ncbi:MAG: hypothetical protein ACR2KK_19520 [Acidimicrobiales bacterium]
MATVVDVVLVDVDVVVEVVEVTVVDVVLVDVLLVDVDVVVVWASAAGASDQARHTITRAAIRLRMSASCSPS